MSLTTRLPFVGIAAALFVAVSFSQPPKQPEPTPEEKLARERMSTRFVVGPAIVLHGDAFATDRASVEKQYGVQISTTTYTRDGSELKSPPGPGPLFLVHTVKFPDGHTSTRFQTVFLAPAWPTGAKKNPGVEEDRKQLAAWKFDPANPQELAQFTGVDAELVKKQSKLIEGVCKARPLSELLTDERFARLLAGLSLMPKDAEKVNRLNDAFAYERQAWVNVRRKITGFDKAYPKPFEGPDLIKGASATEVREGTEVEAGVKPGTAAKIDEALTEWAKDDDQAFAVCIVRNGVIVLHKAYGTRDDKPMTVDTPSWMASITKPMSASLVLMLADRGWLTLDDPVSKLSPALRDIKLSKPLLVRHLHTHTNGLEKFPTGDDTLNDLEYRIADCYPVLKVGSTWAYNGGGYALGGKIIENLTGEAVPLFYKKHLLDPLGCTGTDVNGTHADAQGIPLDIAKFGQMLLNRGAYGKYRFFSEETFEQMLPRKLTTELGPDATKTFGFGLDGQPKKFGHGAASAATFSIDVERKLVVVMTRNKMGKNQDKYNSKFWNAINAGIEPAK